MDFLILVLDRIWESKLFWLTTLGLLHLFIIYFREKKYFFGILIVSFIFLWIFVGDPLMKSVINLGYDSIHELSNPSISEILFWFQTIIGSSLPSIKFIILWSVIFIFYFSIIAVYRTKKKYYFYRVEKGIAIFLILFSPLLTMIIKTPLLGVTYENFKSIKQQFVYDDSMYKVINTNKSVPVFLYIGESTSTMNMQIYGYPRKTNTKLTTFFKNNPNSLIIPNIFSTHTHSEPSLVEALSLKPNAIKKEKILSTFQRKHIPLIDLLKKNNFQTKIYSNQLVDRYLSIIFNGSKIDYFREINKKNLYDHQVIDKFIADLKLNDESIKDLNIFHSYAGHGDYKKNIPENFYQKVDNFFSELDKKTIFGELVNSNLNKVEYYDSAMSYIDSNISKALNFVKNSNRPMVFIYFSDHGESVYTNRAHDSSRYVYEMSTIPFIVYFNDEAMKLDNKRFNNIKKRIYNNEFATSSQLPSLISEILGIEIINNISGEKLNDCQLGQKKCSDKYLVIREVSKKNYSVVRTNIIDDLNPETKDNTDFTMDHFNLNKELSNLNICYHRSNTIAKALRGLLATNCIEFDLVVSNSNQLNIYHPDSGSKQTQFNLDKMMDLVGNRKVTLWIDGKNIDDKINCNALKDKISLINNKNINFFIEFPSSVFKIKDELSNCINFFREQGHATSYYLPEFADNCSKSIKKGEIFDQNKNCKKLRKIITSIVQSNYFSDLSFGYSSLDAILKIDIAKKLLWNTWHIEPHKVLDIPADQFRLVIPFNKDPNSI